MKRLCLRMKEVGVDTDSVVTRLGGNVKLYLSICLKFLTDPTFYFITKAVSQNNFTEALVHIHTLKGVAANLGFVRLQLLCKNLIEELNNREYSDFYKDYSVLEKEYRTLISILTVVKKET